MKTICIIFFNVLLLTALHAEVSNRTLAPYYLLQFAKHIQKQNEKSSYNIHILSGDNNLQREFNKVFKTKKIQAKDIQLTQSNDLTIPRHTDMIYMAPDTQVPFSKLSNYIIGKSILLVSYEEEDKKNVMLNIFTTPEQKLGFEINRANILNEGFTISDQVVLMGGTELDVAKLFKGAKQSLKENELILQKNKLQLKESNQRLQRAEEKLQKAQDRLVVLNEQTKKYQEDIEKAKKSIEKINNDMLREQAVYKQQVVKNQTLEEMVSENQKINTKVKDELDKLLSVIEKKNQFIRTREQDLIVLNKDIAEKEKIVKELSKITETQGEQISVQESRIDLQQKIIYFVVAALVIFILLIIGIVIIMRRLKATLIQLKETQAELVETEKMASLGKLVSGLAHEMNTPVGVSMTGISLLKTKSHSIQDKLNTKVLKQSELIKFFESITDIAASTEISLKKAAHLIQSFKEVSVDQQLNDLREFNLKEYIDTILVGFNNQLRHSKIKIHVDIDDSFVITSYPGLYYQILTNLINNSLLHAFSKEDEGDIIIWARMKNDTIHLIYEDNGEGISKENLSQIFEPFFTTKRANGGTGLGLHIIYNIITQKLRGKIEVKSQEGKGIKVNMILPLEISSNK